MHPSMQRSQGDVIEFPTTLERQYHPTTLMGLKARGQEAVHRSLLRLSKGVVDPRLVVSAGYIRGVRPHKIQGNSIDLTVRDVFRIDGGVTLYANGERKLPEYVLQSHWPQPNGGHWFKLEPEHLYQIEFFERVTLPRFLCGITLVRSTMAKSGCSGENGLFDSGYDGTTGMMVSVKFTSFIEKGSSIAQMMFLKSKARSRYNGYYQQTEGPSDWLRKYQSE